MKKISLLLLAGFMALTFLGCTSVEEGVISTTTTTTTTVSTTSTTLLPIHEYKSDLEASVFTDKSSYSVSEDVTFTLKVRNKISSTIESFFPTTQTYDLFVYKSGVYTWQRYYNQAFLGIPIPFRLEPGSIEVIVNYVWDQKDNSGSAVGAGSYSVTGYVGDPLRDISSSESFSIL